ncbi:MAG: metallophosphoesterase [Candidatus Woesearchaeota archaeon]
MNKQDVISLLLEKGVLVTPEELGLLGALSEQELKQFIISKEQGADFSLKKQENKESPVLFPETNITVLDEFKENPKKINVKDFVDVFNNRYEAIASMLKQRSELHSVVSVARAKSSANKRVAIIGMVSEKSITKNNFIILKLEDQTGIIDAVIGPGNSEQYAAAEDVVEDEVLGVIGSVKNNTLFINTLYLPDVPYGGKLKKSPEEEYLVVLGDLHFGSRLFLKKEFEKFLLWINGIVGNEEQKRTAAKTRYIALTGDTVEGVGVYPSQEKELEIKDIRLQYDGLAALLKKIPARIQIIIIPGNHDACRLQEPQSQISRDFASSLWQLPNVRMASNPCMVRIAQKKDFEGFDILFDHGYSLIFFSQNVKSIREAGGQKRTDLIMKFLLQRRHLAPTHSSMAYIPSVPDPLIINRVPDFFITGHVHRSAVANYKNITLVNSSCWNDISADQIKRGLEPLPGRLPIINLKTREVKIMNFYKGESG